VLAAQAEEQSRQLPGLEDAVRAAQQTASQQRSAVAQVQQQIQVLAAESRSVEEQSRALKGRRERLAGEKQGLQAPDLGRLEQLKVDEAAANEARDEADARLHELQEEVPALDAQRRDAQAASSAESARLADIGARLDALRALQDKVQTEGKLKPWLEKHGLAGLQGCGRRSTSRPAGRPRSKAALRERLNALRSAARHVRAFAADAPPAKLAFYTPPQAAIANTHQTLPRLSDLLRLGDAGLKALLNDWLEGVYTAPTSTRRSRRAPS
jgi:chromosome segregation protein